MASPCTLANGGARDPADDVDTWRLCPLHSPLLAVLLRHSATVVTSHSPSMAASGDHGVSCLYEPLVERISDWAAEEIWDLDALGGVGPPSRSACPYLSPQWR